MSVRKNSVLTVALLCVISLGIVGCGGDSKTTHFGAQGFAITGVVPSTVSAMIPTPVVISGGDWSNLVGTPVQVTFTADGGFTPFDGGTAASVTVTGTVTSASTIAVTTPAATVCGPASITATVGITLSSGVFDSTGAGFITFSAPAMASVVNGVLGGTVFDAAVSDPVTITGTGFGDIGATVDVFWRSTPAGGGPLLFEAGSSMTTKTTGTVVSATTITTNSPLALVCGAMITAQPAEIFRIDFRDGSCSPTAGPFLAVTFRAPRITPLGAGVTNAAVAPSPYAGSTAPAMFAAAVPEPFTIAGTGFGPVGGTVTINWTSAAGTTIYNGATTTSTSVTGTITSRTAISATASPGAAVCTVAMDAQNIMVTMPNGSCSPSGVDGLGAATQIGPTVTAVANLTRPGGTTSGSGALFFGQIPETFQITGTDFGPVGGTALVTLTETAAAPNATPFAGGTAAMATVLATITSRTTMQGTTPFGTYVGADVGNPAATPCQFGSGMPGWVATLEGGSCNMTAFNPGVTFDGPVGVGIAAAAVPSTIRLGQLTADAFTYTGLGFSPVGGQAMVMFDDPTTTNFDGGAAGATVTGTIVSETMITGTLPTITAGVPNARLAADLLVRTTVTLPNAGGSTNCPQDVTFTAPPTITALANTDAAGAAAPSTFPVPGAPAFLGCHASLTTLTGNGFLAAGPNGPTTTVIYDLNSGVGPRTGTPPLAPVRRIGTGAPVGDDLGSATTTPAFAITPGVAGTIAGRVRTETVLPDLDHDSNGMVTFRVRVLNLDGQFHETGTTVPDPIWGMAGALIAPGPSAANIRDGNDVAIDPASMPAGDDFLTAAPDAVDNANMTVVSNDYPNAGIFGPFDGTGLSVQFTRDGGLSWTDASAAWSGATLSGLDTLPAAALRRGVQCEYDTFGNLWVSYVATDFIGGAERLLIIRSTDQGATPAAGGVFVTPGAPPGAAEHPDLAVGPDPATAAGNEQAVITWVNQGVFPPVVQVSGATNGAFGGVVVFLGLFALPDVPPPAMGFANARCSIGPMGQTHVAWTQTNFLGGPHTLLCSNDADGLAGATFGFPPAGSVVDLVPPLFLGNPAMPDALIFGPVCDLAVAHTGTNAGRLVIAYDDVIPGAGAQPDRTQVVTRFSDTDGTTWSGTATSVHQVDNAFQFLPGIACDRITGRFYVAWYDTRNSPGNTGYDRFAAASNAGTSWGTSMRLSTATESQVANFDGDFGFFAGVSAFRGCAAAAWTSDGTAGPQDPRVRTYQQNATSTP